MHNKTKRVTTFLDDHGLPYRLETHEAVFTVAESTKVLSEKVPVKTLLVAEEKGAREFMVAMRGDERLDMKQLAGLLGLKKLRFVKPERVEELVGVKPGSVSVFGLLHDGAEQLELIIDDRLLDEPEIGFHPNENTATVFMTPTDVLQAIAAMGFVPNILTL